MLDLDFKFGTAPPVYDVLGTKPKLPNVKTWFEPDPGYLICDCDLEQADAQIVAEEANDDILRAIFADPLKDLHIENAKMIFGECHGKKDPRRQKAKGGCHAANYGVFAATLATALGITRMEAQAFLDKWFRIHPGIADWHTRISAEMLGRGYIENAFGNRKLFLGRTDHPTALAEALAWIPQSTVGLIINRAWRNLEENFDGKIQVLMQVHDSLVFQVKKKEFRELLPSICDAFKIVVPYEKPLIIGSGIEISHQNWGACRPLSWDGFYLDSEGDKTDEEMVY